MFLTFKDYPFRLLCAIMSPKQCCCGHRRSDVALNAFGDLSSKAFLFSSQIGDLL